MGRLTNNWVAVAWAPYSRMSETFVREVKGHLYCIYYLNFRSKAWAAPKYVLQAMRTLLILFTEQPSKVHAQNPPFVCGLMVYLYCVIRGAHFVLHYHSAAFAGVWKWALPVQKFLARRAAANIVTNRHWARRVQSWGGKVIVMVDPFLELPRGKHFPVTGDFNVALVSTFAPDEPLEAVLVAAKSLPEVQFYITGEERKIPTHLKALIPQNVTLTGWLDPQREYPALLRAVDAIMVLTTRNYTLQLGGCEAVSVGKPLITSDWPYLREVFKRGAVFVSNSAESIREGVFRVRQDYSMLAEEISELRHEGRLEWRSRLEELKNMIEADRLGQAKLEC